MFAALLVGLLALYVLMAAPWPQLGPDEAAWATSVVKVLKGKVLGREAMLAKGPYLVAWHLLAYLASGPNVMALHLLGAAWALLTGVVVCLVALRLAGRIGCLATGLLYVAALSDPALRTNVYAEIIMALPLALGMVALAVGLSRGNLALVAAAGCCAGLAVLTKQTAVFYALAMAAVVLAYRRAPVSAEWGRGRGLGQGLAALLAGGLLAGLPWLVYLWHHGAGAGFAEGLIGGGPQYLAGLSAGQLLQNLAWSVVHVLPRYTIVLVVSLAGLTYLSKQRARVRKQLSRRSGFPARQPLSRGMVDAGRAGKPVLRRSLLLRARSAAARTEAVWYLVIGAWYVAAVMAVAVTGRFAAHYFSQLFPPAALLGGLWLAHKLRETAARPNPLAFFPGREGGTGDRCKLNLGALIVAAQLLVLIPVGAMNLGHWREALVVTAAGSPWRQVGEYLREHTDPQDTVFVWGDQTEVLYWAGRELACDDPWITLGLLGFAHQGPLFATRVRPAPDWQGLREQLDRWQPAYVVVAPVIQTVAPPEGLRFGPEQLPELSSILESGYDHETTVAGYQLYVRRAPGETFLEKGFPRSPFQKLSEVTMPLSGRRAWARRTHNDPRMGRASCADLSPFDSPFRVPAAQQWVREGGG